MSKQKRGHCNVPWGKTSLFSHKSGPKRTHGISKDDKERFFRHGILPKIKHSHESEKKQTPVDTELLQEATTILNKVREEFGNGEKFIEAAYGKSIEASRASEVIHNYLVEHGIDGMMSVYFSPELDCSGKMSWTGPLNKYNQPERRHYSMWIKNAADNIYLRETGILNLSNHEIGTHFLRSLNDGLQPWFSNRSKFGIGPYKCRDMKDTEEGLASLNTAFESNVKYIWGPAMLYYAACMSLQMNFKELFDHLHKYVADPEIRWKYVARIKHGRNPTHLGGHGKDQCYFRGAVRILRSMDSIDFLLLHTGKITVDDQCRIQRIARTGCIKIPYFLKDMRNYRKNIRLISKLNAINKPKTALVKEPVMKISMHNQESSQKDKASRKQKAKKSPKSTALEAKERILSTKLLAKSKFLSSSDIIKIGNGDFVAERDDDSDREHVGQIESDAEDEKPVAPHAQRSPDVHNLPTKSPASSSVIVNTSELRAKQRSTKVDTIDSNSYKAVAYSGLLPVENFSDIMKSLPAVEDNARALPVARPPTASKRSQDTSQQTTVVLKYTSSRESVMTPSANSPNAVKEAEGVTSYVRPITATANQRETRSTANMQNRSFDRRPEQRRNSTGRNEFAPRRRSRAENAKQPKKRATPKKGVKKKFSQFFSDLIPFSRSRKKRVLPLPNN